MIRTWSLDMPRAIINGPAHHTLHHLYFNVNYGQYFTGQTDGVFLPPTGLGTRSLLESLLPKKLKRKITRKGGINNAVTVID